MNLEIAPSHRTFFIKNKFIVFDDILTASELSALQTLVSEIPLENATNLFLRYPAFQKYIFSKKLAQLVFSLLNINPIRIASDQYIYSGSQHVIAATLQEIGTLQPLICGLLLNINETSLEVPQDSESSMPFPINPGSVVFIHPDFKFPYDQLSNYAGGQFLLITYGSKRLIYTQNDSDPDLYFLKKQGYNFEMPISSATHPLLIDLPQPYLFKS
jgi:hypothetical protein